MKEEVTRIMRLVQQGKLSPEDAAELIEVFTEAQVGDEDATPPDGAKPAEDPFAKLIAGIEKVSKDVARNVNWQDVAGQVRQGVNRGVDALRQAAEDARKSGNWGPLFGQTFSRQVEMPLEITAGKAIRIEGGSGDIRIAGGSTKPSVSFNATFRAADMASAQASAEAWTPLIEEGESHILIRRPDETSASVAIQLTVPQGTPIEVSTASGDVEVTATLAALRVHGLSSNVKASGIGGGVEISVASGDVDVLHSEVSFLQVESRSGDIILHDVKGSITVRTSAGDVGLVDCQAKTLSVESASGNVNVDLSAPVTGASSVRTVSGDVTVGIVDGSDCRVSISALRGSVSTTFELADMTQDGLMITGRLGSGTGTLDLSAVNGDVRLERRDSTS